MEGSLHNCVLVPKVSSASTQRISSRYSTIYPLEKRATRLHIIPTGRPAFNSMIKLNQGEML